MVDGRASLSTWRLVKLSPEPKSFYDKNDLLSTFWISLYVLAVAFSILFPSCYNLLAMGFVPICPNNHCTHKAGKHAHITEGGGGGGVAVD
jgi:hypothetical protein